MADMLADGAKWPRDDLDPLFLDEGIDEGDSDAVPVEGGDCWTILIVDDEEDVHKVTTLALRRFDFEGRPLRFLSAYSGAEARKILSEHSDIAIVLLDVVMEDNHAGLEVAKFIREEIGNKTVRIVLRTGQPGTAPEETVIRSYDINDYKEKSELTRRKLTTLMYSLLRSYRDILAIEANKVGLEHVIEASANIMELRSLERFAAGVLEQLTSLLHLRRGAIFCQLKGFTALHTEDDYHVLASSGAIAGQHGHILTRDCEVRRMLDEAVKNKRSVFGAHNYIGYFSTSAGKENLVYIEGFYDLSQLDVALIEVFARNVSIAFENIDLHREVEDTQQEIVYMLGEAVETRSRETGNHVRRVAEISKVLGLAYGLDDHEAEVLRLASPLHDLGKIGIPDAILNKPGKLTPDEWAIMQSHATLGHTMLHKSRRRILQAAAVIAEQHHERWDGQGYPKGLKGEEIDILGRITALADVFDALGSERCYKEAWPIDEVLAYIDRQKGTQFDPTLVDLFRANLETILAIKDRFRDDVVAS